MGLVCSAGMEGLGCFCLAVRTFLCGGVDCCLDLLGW